jgi:integrase
MKREKIVILPKLCDFGGDLSKKWYVFYSVRDPRTHKMKVFKDSKGLFVLKTSRERYHQAAKIINHYTELLKNGYNPFIDESQVIYNDSLQYHHAARVYQARKANNRTFNYWANEYLKMQTGGLASETISTYKSKIRTFENWLILRRYNELDISALENKVVVDFFVYLNNDRKSSAITYRKYKNLLTDLFDYVMERKGINTNPVQRLPKCTRVVEMAPSPINPEDIGLFMDRIKHDKQMMLFVMFEYYCFMRPGEIRMMKISWIDWGNGIVRIPQNMNKTKKAKTPILPHEFLRQLRVEHQLHTYPKDFYVISTANAPGKQHIGKNTMRNRFNKIRAELNMPPDYMLYSWKHTGNGILEKAGANPFERMMQNGHSSVVTTEKYTRKKFGFESDLIRNRFPTL